MMKKLCLTLFALCLPILSIPLEDSQLHARFNWNININTCIYPNYWGPYGNPYYSPYFYPYPPPFGYPPPPPPFYCW